MNILLTYFTTYRILKQNRKEGMLDLEKVITDDGKPFSFTYVFG